MGDYFIFDVIKYFWLQEMNYLCLCSYASVCVWGGGAWLGGNYLGGRLVINTQILICVSFLIERYM